MDISITMQVQYDPDNVGRSPVLLSATVPDNAMTPVFATGTFGRLELLVTQVIDDAIVRAHAAPAGEAEETQETETAMAEVPDTEVSPPASPTQSDPDQLTLLSF